MFHNHDGWMCNSPVINGIRNSNFKITTLTSQVKNLFIFIFFMLIASYEILVKEFYQLDS